MEDFLLLADSFPAAPNVRTRVDAILTRLGLLRNPTKSNWTLTHVGNHLGLTIDLQPYEFRAPSDKLHTLAKHASSLLGRTVSNARRLLDGQVAAFAGKARFLYLAIAPACFFFTSTPQRPRYPHQVG
jgi:hypothetical protein